MVFAPHASRITRHSSLVTRHLWWLLALLGVALLSPRLLQFAQISTTMVAWPWQFDFTEGVNLSATYQLAGGANIYRPNGPDAFVSAPYTPLFFALNAPIMGITGPSFGPGRAISLIATLAIAVMVALAVLKVTSRLWPGLVAGAVWLSLSPVIVWSALYTQNMLALAFAMAGLTWALFYPDGQRSYVAILFFALAFFTKQTAVEAALATTVWLLWRNWRSGVRFMLWLVAAIAVPFGLANLYLQGGLWQHTISNQVLPWSADRMWRTLNRVWAEYWPLLVWAGGALVTALTLLLARIRSTGGIAAARAYLATPFSLICLFLLTAGALTPARIGRDGANYNHLLELLLASCLATGSLLGLASAQVYVEGRARRWVGAVGLLVMSALFAWQISALKDPQSWYRGFWPSAPHDTQMRLISNLVASTQGEVYSEDIYLLLINGRPIRYDDPFMFTTLAKAGRWDDSVFTQWLRERRFALILMERGSKRFTPEGLKAFNANYDILYEDIRDSYAPKPAQPTP